MADSVTIRRMVPGDEDAVMRAAAIFDDAPDRDAVRAFLADPRDVLLIAYAGDDPAGFVRAHVLPRLDGVRPQMFLYEIQVAPSYRRRGIARALIGELLRISRDGDFDEMFVMTNACNTPAMRMYESTGGRREADDDVLFVYALSDDPSST